LDPLLPIPNRTVKRLSADDSAGSRVKVGHCQALMPQNAHSVEWAFCFVEPALVGQLYRLDSRRCRTVWVSSLLDLLGRELWPVCGAYYVGKVVVEKTFYPSLLSSLDRLQEGAYARLAAP
jgi:hypothetical protein